MREATERASRNKNVDRMEFMLTLRRRGITDPPVLRAMDDVPREMFVQRRRHAARPITDHALPIACGQTISQPYVVAYMTELLELRPHHRVLEIGTGSGYQAAVLSRTRGAGGLGRALPHAGRAGAQDLRSRIGYDNVDGDRGRRPRGRAAARAVSTASSSRRPPKRSRRR